MTSAPVVAPAHVRAPQIWTIAGVFAGCLILLARHPSGHPAWHTLWAEDGHVFVQCAAQRGIGCLGTQWDGYLHVVPRLLALIVSALPVGSWAIAASMLAIAVAAVALTVIWTAAAWLLPGGLMRAAVVFVTAASAAMQREVAGNLANLHWFLLAAALALALNPAAGRGRAVTLGRSCWLLATCLSDPFGALLVAAFVTGMVVRARRRGRWQFADLALAGALLAASAIQLAVVATSPRADAGDRIGMARALRLYADTVVRVGWLGPRRGASALALVAILGCLALIVAGVWHGPPRRDARRVAGAAALLAASPAFYLILVLLDHGAPLRYAAVPFLFVVVGGTALMAEACAGWARGQIAALGLVTAVLAVMVAVGPYPPLVSESGPAWHTAVAAARASCRAGHDVVEPVDIAPGPEWALHLSCRRLLAG